MVLEKDSLILYDLAFLSLDQPLDQIAPRSLLPRFEKAYYLQNIHLRMGHHFI